MSVIDIHGIAPTDGNGDRLVLEPLDVLEKRPVLDDREALEEERNALVGALTAKGYSQEEAAAILGVSARTVRRRWRAVRPGAPVPRLAPVFGADPAWSPETEDWESVPEICPRCGSEIGPVQPGAALVCLACGRSGYDDQVAVDLAKDRQDETRRESARRAEAARLRAERRAARARKSIKAG